MTRRRLDIHLLGPIGAERDGEPVSLGGGASGFARLAIGAGQIVTVDRLVDDVWAGEPPATAVNTLQSYVSLLRRALGDPPPAARGARVCAQRYPNQLDAFRFEDLVTAGRSMLAADPNAALYGSTPRSTNGAVRPWPTSPTRSGRSTAVLWDELRLTALEARFDALLALARHADVVGEIERAVDEYPLREGFACR